MTSEQLTLFGPSAFYIPPHDTAVISVRRDLDWHPKLSRDFLLNGGRCRPARYPEFDALKNTEDFTHAELKDLPAARAACPFCLNNLLRREEIHHDPEWDDDAEERRLSRTLRERCPGCSFWQFHELRSAIYYDRGYLADFHELTTIASKVREFNEAPEEALWEVAQWFKRNPGLFHSVDPTYLEKLVGRIFSAAGNYSDVTHIGGPGDGGIDLVLIQNDESTSLVQVKRRESPTASESVQTIRNLLGAMVLDDSRAGIVVSTADHFTQRARQASVKAGNKGFRIDLIDRHALDRMLSQNLFSTPWENISKNMEAERGLWFRQGPEWSSIEPGYRWDEKSQAVANPD
jgi:hypothetical protein